MARIRASVHTSHVPAMGAAMDLCKAGEPHWQPVLQGDGYSRQRMREQRPDMARRNATTGARNLPAMRKNMPNQACVVLLPGLLCDAALWAQQVQALDPAHCVVPSYGELSSITGMAQHVLDTAPAEHLCVAGHSMGGRVALEMARLAPQRVCRLALLDTGMDPLAPGQAGEHERAKRMGLLQMAREHGMRAMGRQWAQGMVHASRWNTPLFENILDMIERQTPAIFAAQLEALLTRPDARELLAQLRCPTLLVCGRQDAWSPLSRHEEMHALVPGSRLAIVEDSGHMSPMEQPAAVSQALKEWMQP